MDTRTAADASAVANNNDPPAFRRRGDGPVFTANKCPPGPGLACTCELPFGFIWTPMSPSSSVAPVSSSYFSSSTVVPPVMCLTCLAYINLYSIVDEATGLWTCSLCGAQNVAPVSIFDSQTDANQSLALVAPVFEFRQRVEHTADSSLADNVRSYVLVLDGNLSCNEVNAVVTSIQQLLLEEAARGTLVELALVIFDESVSVYQLGITGMASADVYPPLPEHVEEHDDEEETFQRRLRMQNRSYFVQVRSENDLATLWLCVAAVFGVQVQKTQVGEGGQASAPSQTLSRKERLRLRREARVRKELSDSSLKAEIVADEATSAESPWVTKDRGPPVRCTGEATQCAADLAIFGPLRQPQSSRILLFTNGCPNVGVGSIINRALTDDRVSQNGHIVRPSLHSVDSNQMVRSVQYFKVVGEYASENGIGVDVFCAGPESLGIPAFQALVKPSEGYALSHDSFSSPQLSHNLSYIVSQTQMSVACCEDDGQQPLGSAPHPPIMNLLDGCVADVRTSSFLTPTHINGAGEVLGDDIPGLLVNERPAFATQSSFAASRGFETTNKPSKEVLADSLTRIRFGRYDPLSTVSVVLQVDDEFLPGEDRYAVIQCTVRYVDSATRELVTRVSTNRLPVARSVHDFLESMDEEAVPVVLGKEAVYRSIVGREEEETPATDVDRTEFLAFEAQSDLDATVHRISGSFRLLGLEEGNLSDRIFAEEGGIGSTSSSLDFAFPPELADALHRLFHLRRGSLLSPGPLQSVDDRAEKRSLFLRLPLDDCLCMMAPSLWSASISGSNGDAAFTLEPIPSDTLTLWDNRIIAADHHDTLFVWSGKGVLGHECDDIRNQCRDFLLERSRNRFPMPHFHALSEGHSMSRRFTARLAPSHADPIEHQMVHFPALSGLSATELSALRGKFRFYDEATDASFRRWFWSVASASSSAREEGMSLCE